MLVKSTQINFSLVISEAFVHNKKVILNEQTLIYSQH